MQSLAAYVLAALTTWSSPSEHSFYEPSAQTEARYSAIADDIAEVVATAPGERIEGSADLEALLLASIAVAESHLAADVDACKRGRGDAWSIWQISGTGERGKRNVCKSRREAARVALTMVRESFAVCAKSPLVDRLAFYTDGRCETSWMRSRYRVWRAWHRFRVEPRSNDEVASLFP